MPSFTVSKAAVLALFSVAAQLVLAAPEPAITAAAVIPKRAPVLDTREDVSFRQVLALRNLAGRQSKPGMNVCYGVDSICDLFLDMDCPSSASSEDWYRCMCTTGYISAKAACQDCDSFYNLGGTNDGDKWSKSCSSMSFSIAPIPASILEIQSSRNATLTELKTGGGSGASKTGGSGASKTGSGSAASETGSSSGEGTALDLLPSNGGSSTSARRTFGDYTTTMYGTPTGAMPAPLTTTTGTPPLANSVGTGGANIWDREIVQLFSIGAAVFSVLCGVVLVL